MHSRRIEFVLSKRSDAELAVRTEFNLNSLTNLICSCGSKLIVLISKTMTWNLKKLIVHKSWLLVRLTYASSSRYKMFGMRMQIGFWMATMSYIYQWPGHFRTLDTCSTHNNKSLHTQMGNSTWMLIHSKCAVSRLTGPWLGIELGIQVERDYLWLNQTQIGCYNFYSSFNYQCNLAVSQCCYSATSELSTLM